MSIQRWTLRYTPPLPVQQRQRCKGVGIRGMKNAMAVRNTIGHMAQYQKGLSLLDYIWGQPEEGTCLLGNRGILLHGHQRLAT